MLQPMDLQRVGHSCLKLSLFFFSVALTFHLYFINLVKACYFIVCFSNFFGKEIGKVSKFVNCGYNAQH